VFPGRREQLWVRWHNRVWVGAEEEGSRCGGCWAEQPGLLEEDCVASRGGAVTAGRRRNQRAKGSGRSLFLEEKTMERKKRREAAVLMVFLHCWCSADDRLGRLVVFGLEGAGKRCRFEGRRRCWDRLEREKENEGLCREGSPAGRGKPKTWGATGCERDRFRVFSFFFICQNCPLLCLAENEGYL